MNTADEYQMWELIRSPEPSNWVADHLAIDISRKYAVYNKATRRIWYHADHLDAISTYDIVGIYNQTRADRQVLAVILSIPTSILTFGSGNLSEILELVAFSSGRTTSGKRIRSRA